MTDDKHAMVLVSGDEPDKWFDGTQSDWLSDIQYMELIGCDPWW